MRKKEKTKVKFNSKCNLKVELFMKRKLMLFMSLLLISIGLATAQTQVKGVVVDEAGEPVIGATILIKGTSQGTITDYDGNFALTTPAKATLVVSYVGLNTQEVAATPNMRIVLRPDSELLEEILVVAYGTQTKESLTGSVGEVRAQEIERITSGNVVQGMTGKVAGVQVFSSSGLPGQAPTVRFRGIGSINGSSAPLYVVDGVPFTGDVSSISNHDIESMTFLKDAAASSLYGTVSIIFLPKMVNGRNFPIRYRAQMPKRPDQI